jgi:hypothetical protein
MKVLSRSSQGAADRSVKGRVSRAPREYQRRATIREMKMLWGKRRGCDTVGAVQQTDGAPHVATF